MQAARKLEPTEKPKSQKFSLRTPYMKQGRITQLVAETENMWIHTKINADIGLPDDPGTKALYAFLDAALKQK